MSCSSTVRQSSAWFVFLGIAAGFWLGLILAETSSAQEPTKAKATAKVKARAKSKAKAKDDGPSPPVTEEAKDDESKAEDQGKAEGDESKKAESPPGIFGDPKRFTKLGGWGSIGGSMGQMGMARSALIMMPPVQEELKLTEAQKKQIREWLEGMRKSGEEMGKAMREQAGDPSQQENTPIAARIFQFTRMLDQVSSLLRENENGLAKILDKSQRTRLSQVALQMEGIAAVTKPEVAKAINLSPDQQELIQQIIAQSRLMQMTSWMEQGIRMNSRFRERPVAGAAPSGRRPTEKDAGAARAAVKADPDDEDQVRAEQAKAMRKEFESMRARTDTIQERTVLQIVKTLTLRQREKFVKLLGEPFDPSQVNTMGRPGGRPTSAPTSKDGRPSPSPAPGQGSGLPPSNQGASRK